MSTITLTDDALDEADEIREAIDEAERFTCRQGEQGSRGDGGWHVVKRQVEDVGEVCQVCQVCQVADAVAV